MKVYYLRTHKSLSSAALFLFLLAVISLLSACRHSHKQSPPLVYTDGSVAFNKIIDRASAINDAGNTDQALSYIDSVYRHHKPANIIDQVHYYYFHFDIYEHKQRYATALQYADSMLAIIGKSPYKEQYIKQYIEAVYSRGDALFGAGNYSDAYKNFYNAKVLAQNNFDSCGVNHYNYRLAVVLYRQGHYTEANTYFHLSIAELGYCTFSFSAFYRTQEILDNIGLCYYHVGNNDSALLYFNKALGYLGANTAMFHDKTMRLYYQAQAVIYGNMASVYIDKGDFPRAETLLHKSIQINGQPGYDNIDAQLSRLKLARLYILKKDYQASFNELHMIETGLDTMPNTRVQLEWSDAMSHYYNHISQPQQAYNYLLIYNRINDSLDNATKELKETDWNELVNNQEKQYQINILEKNNQLKQYYLIIVAIIAIASIIILFLIQQNYRRSSKNVKQLTDLNNRINDQNLKLEIVLKNLELADKEKDRILRAVAHDIRNPIAAISSLASLLLDESATLNSEQKEMLGLVVSASNDALMLTKEIIEVSDPARFENLSKERISVNVLLANGVELLRFRAAEKKQKILLNIPHSLPLLYVNREKVWRAVSNIITNAIKFSPEGSNIHITAILSGQNIIIAIKDNGIGIPEQIKDKIFDMFTEAKRPGTAGERPFGLGLSISKQIIEAHGGTITFSSSDSGTTFYISLPIVE